MIYEIALLPVYKERIETFRQAFTEVVPLLSRAQGYRGHLLAQGIESPEVFNLIVRWHSLEDHTPGFEASEDHRIFMMGLRKYFSNEPTVYHIEGGAFSTSEHDANSAVSTGNATHQSGVARNSPSVMP
ncbi:antibiotic biosynthesis monooxygenase family protein [Phyllobacterium sp. 22229]|uniref:Antibiotic biosynthesis monooxygenase n=1 Tax=Phyllobacterium myrsinacearum TaxID=28101 RepID=A0A2S9JAW4_9HYPH|nr:antibiotic biosynthesis monooxygenase [Phyllobacterium myrsinacearum]PRD49927.1 antibiotic biosynthesis monooxygenase [Phyllobacterium myrsinacearum]PWV86578.1 heme-degrading monooxygenase HmoA [Phyllobacterium myrsinacearum]RZU96930.1 heme-degrading monooxygenase HmoA [Phyllobacterium myrsinacearum]